MYLLPKSYNKSKIVYQTYDLDNYSGKKLKVKTDITQELRVILK